MKQRWDRQRLSRREATLGSNVGTGKGQRTWRTLVENVGTGNVFREASLGQATSLEAWTRRNWQISPKQAKKLVRFDFLFSTIVLEADRLQFWVEQNKEWSITTTSHELVDLLITGHHRCNSRRVRGAQLNSGDYDLRKN